MIVSPQNGNLTRSASIQQALSGKVARELKQLTESLCDTIPDALQFIEGTANGSSPSQLDSAINSAHQIRGAAGSLGLAAISAAFAVLEDQLKAMKANDLFHDSFSKSALDNTLQLCKMLLACREKGLLDNDYEEESKEGVPLLSADARFEEMEYIKDMAGQLVLLVEDDPVFISIVQAVLATDDEYTNALVSAKTMKEAVAILGEHEPDIILLDLTLSDSSGIQTLHTIQEHAPGVPILILTGLDDIALADESVLSGAQDYLVKGRISPNALNRCIRYSIKRFRAEESVVRLRAIEDFNCALAHDFIVPVQGLDRLLDHIQAGHVGELNGELRNAISIMNKSNKGLLHRLNRLLSLYRVEFGSVEPVWEDVEVAQVVDECVRNKRAILEKKQIMVQIDKDENVCSHSDRHLLMDVLDELVNNAINFSPARKTVSISLKRENDQVTIAVSNSGPSISNQDRNRLFKKFWRGIPGVTFVATTGLGLYYSHQLLNVLKGSIACQNEIEKTTFLVRLPVSTNLNAATPASS